MQLFDIIVALIFLCSLVAISRFRQYLTAEDRQSYNHTALGLSILAVVSLIQIYNGLGVLRAVPFVSDPLFFKLAYSIGVITGLTFLISGVTSWVPLSRSYRMFNKDKIRKLELIKKTEQLARVENRLPVIFQKTLEQMLGSYTLAKGAAFIYSHRSSQLVCVGPETTDGEDGLDCSGIIFSKSVASSLSKHCGVTADIVIDKLPQGLSMPELIVPAMAGDRLAGLFLLWEVESSRLSDEDRINLKIAADVIGRKVHTDYLAMKASFERGLQTWRDVLTSRLDWRREGKETLSKIVDYLRGKAAFDFFSLTIVYRGNVAQRYTLGETGGLLSESNLDFSQTDNLTREVLVGRKPKYEADLEAGSAASVDNMVSKGGYRSLLLHPVTIGNSTDAIVTLASRTPAHFTSTRRRYVESLMPVLADFVAFDKHRHEIGIRERRAFVINDFVSEIRQQEDLQAIISRAAAILSKELKSTVVRVSTVDADGAFLNSRALELNGKVGSVTPVEGSMILSLMPYHQLVLDTGRPMMINQESTDRKMTEPESTQVFGVDLKSALIVPVKVNSSNVAVLSLADVRNWTDYQFSQADIQFVTSIAVVLEMAIQVARARKPVRSLKMPKAKTSEKAGSDIDAKNRVRSSLSGILGSVELLKTSKAPTGQNLDKCLSIIDRSARRIGEYFATVDSD